MFPKLVGLDDAVRKLDNAVWYWIVIAIAFNVAAFGAYVALFRGILGGTRDDAVHRRLDLKASYQITMAGLAATRIFSAAGAGGHRADLLGAAQGGHAAPALRLPDGRLPGAHSTASTCSR